MTQIHDDTSADGDDVDEFDAADALAAAASDFADAEYGGAGTEAVDEVLHPDDADDATAATDPVGPEDLDGADAAPAPGRLKTRSALRKEWATTERARRYAARRSVRFPIFTRSILLWVMLFSLFGVAFGVSGAFWWAHFNTQVNELRDETRDFEQRAQNALSSIDAQRNEALRQIQESVKPVANVLNQANMVKLADRFAPSVWTVTTKDGAGQPTLGTAFAVISNDDETVMLTSYSLVQAAAVSPGPGISIRKQSEEVVAELWAVDPANDLALLKVNRGNIPVLEWAPDDQQATALGTSVFAVSSQGGPGAAVSPGMVIDVSAVGLRHTAKLDLDFRGAPIITSEGKVIGLASLDYRPTLMPSTGEMYYAPLATSACLDVLQCGGGVKERKDKEPDLPPAQGDDTPVETVTGNAPGD